MATNTGVTNARPRNCPQVYIAIAVARSLSGNQEVTTLLLIGYEGASNTPIANRRPNKAAKPRTVPCNSVITDQAIKQKAYRTRGEKRSTKIPPGICRAAYGHPKAENKIPS